ncbi:squalene synthase HpnC [Beijerinckia indica]|uniref:Squalene synthase HpnC n=1 Tax=Beijerinckia indica subsp. indica (strain ATCC 9039 / DSM 1715 / NCIMB 8712) TaxID=395963 RepID=B2ICB7_BEII9|nr:squalene synthase HpnC [Beijerinckia indica]ACB96714.1 squalene synthase HpnC [Beijerinckia indica subsp. indica ATCC 9039]
MTQPATLEVAASKDHHGENFPVASVLIAPRYRPAILAYYRFARAADDIADSPTLTPKEKIARLDAFEATLLGHTDSAATALPLRASLAETGITPRHALDLLTAFRMDAVKTRYADWAELMHYCAYSAAPVGRYVLAVHGESEATWPASDALCAALQVINHLQDCAKDYREINRVYIPLDTLTAQGIGVEALAAPEASTALRACLDGLIDKTADLVATGWLLPPQVRDIRLRIETAMIAQLADKLVTLLQKADPLSEKVHLAKFDFLLQAILGLFKGLFTGFASSPRVGALNSVPAKEK